MRISSRLGLGVEVAAQDRRVRCARRRVAATNSHTAAHLHLADVALVHAPVQVRAEHLERAAAARRRRRAGRRAARRALRARAAGRDSTAVIGHRDRTALPRLSGVRCRGRGRGRARGGSRAASASVRGLALRRRASPRPPGGRCTSASMRRERVDDRRLARLPGTEPPPQVPRQDAQPRLDPFRWLPSRGRRRHAHGGGHYRRVAGVPYPVRPVSTLDVNLLDGAFYAGDPDARVSPAPRRGARLLGSGPGDLGHQPVRRRRRRSRRTPSRYTSSQGSRPRIVGDVSMINNDDPLHQNKRRLVARRFTPRSVKHHEDHVRGRRDRPDRCGRRRAASATSSPISRHHSRRG